jgi:hypothetical protein
MVLSISSNSRLSIVTCPDRRGASAERNRVLRCLRSAMSSRLRRVRERGAFASLQEIERLPLGMENTGADPDEVEIAAFPRAIESQNRDTRDLGGFVA